MFLLKAKDQTQTVVDILEEPATNAAGEVGEELLSTVMTWVTFATESFDRPEALAGIKTFPGASTSLTLAVNTTAIAVRNRLWLNASLHDQ